MEMLKWAFVRCWPLGPSCEVNWDAWAAMGTMAGVLAALFAPFVRDYFLRKKASRLFAITYDQVLSAIELQIEEICAHPSYAGQNSVITDAWVRVDDDAQKELRNRAVRLQLATEIDVDVTKWPGLDMHLALEVVYAITDARRSAVVLVGMLDQEFVTQKDLRFSVAFAELESALKLIQAALHSCQRIAHYRSPDVMD
ncbi:hypothetical protein [Xanthomonas axonopodis]|uniref:Uncharacterized protein n=1 Tax=Xanthomonas axonopodis pv. cajani TaxID=487827 RepID=A0ABX3M653_9XANT|nr:hypothetical protein [Xanthomonas axonopodis]OOX08714.1 hypothetical protein Xcaj_18635 [Xanthomonas axonopodis pv. cajani]